MKQRNAFRLFSVLLVVLMSLSLIACETNPQTPPAGAATAAPGGGSTPVYQSDSQGDQVVQSLDALKTSLDSFDTLGDLDTPPSQ